MADEKLKAKDVLDYLKDNLSQMVSERVTEAVERARKEAGTPAAVKAAHELRQAEAEREGKVAGTVKQAGKFARALAVGKMNLGQASDYCKRVFGDEIMAKALAESTMVDGGVLVPENVSNEITVALRAATVVRALGAREVPMPNGNLSMPYVNTGVTPYAVAENQNTPSSGMTFGQLEMRARKIRAIVPISNDLLRDSSPAADAFVQQDMTQAIRSLEDQYFIRGTGTANQMRGLKYLVPSANILTAQNAVGTAGNETNDEVIEDLMLLLQTVESSNIIIEKGGWIFAPRTKYKLARLKDSGGDFFFRDELTTRGTVFGFPFRSTTTMPINLNDVGTLSSKESEVIFADFDKILIGNAGGLSIEVTPGGAYHDGSTVVSGISTDQTVIAGTLRSDIGARYRGLEIAMLRGATWGV